MSRSIRLVQRLALGATWVLVVSIARATPSTSAHRVEVSAAGCGQAALYFNRVVELLRVELSAFDVEVVAGSISPAQARKEESGAARTISRVTLTTGVERADPREPCESTGSEVVVRVEQTDFSGPASQRRLEISDVAASNRARTLAIAAAELLQATWSNAAASPGNAVSAPTAAPAKPANAGKNGSQGSANSSSAPPLPAGERQAVPARERKPAPAPEREPGVWIEAGLLARGFPSGGTALLGPELSLSVPLASVLTLNLGGEFSSGVASLPFDDANGPSESVSVRTATFSFGPGLRSRGPVALEIGPRLGVGDGRLASVYHARTSEKPWVFVSLDATVRAQLLAGWAGFAGIEVGRTLSNVVLESGDTPLTFRSVELSGVLIGARVGLSFALTHRR